MIHRRRVPVLVMTALLVAVARPAPAATAKQVDEALAKAKGYLYDQQKDGAWETTRTQPSDAVMMKDSRDIEAGQWTGQTALAVYALLAAGEKPTSPQLAPAIDFLKKSQTAGVYALGLRMQVWLHLPATPDVLAAAKRDADILLKSMKTEGSAKGMYDYVPRPGTKAYSHSRAQYGVLGVWAAEQMGIEVPTRYWEIVEQAWVGHQARDGGWTYMAPGESEHATTPGMTAVGVATLFITQDYTRHAEGLACKGNLSNPSIDRGLKWMGDHMKQVATNDEYPRDFPFVTLYAVERIGVAAGVKYIGGVDWYQKGAGWLLTKQGKTGAFAAGGGKLGSGSVVETAFGMLFLARGRAPIAFNKLDYAKGQTGPQSPPWNQRPRDVANAARWIGRSVEQDLNWQVVPPTAPLTDLADAPILYVAGNKPIVLDDAEKARLREYVEAGGLIVGNADCGNAAFAASFRKLAAELFPAYPFRDLPAEHPMYTGVFPRTKWKTKPVVQGLSNGARELMVLVPQADPSRQWQSRLVGGKEELWQIAGALFLYASEGRDLRYRGENHLVARDPAVKPTRALPVTRLQHAGNWDPEPGGWPRVANVAHNQQRIDVKLGTAKLGDGQLTTGQLAGAGVAHLTGTAKLTLTAAQRAELKKFVDGGGLLLVDAAGGSGAFADSARAELAQAFGTLALINEEHPLFAPGGGAKIEVRYRRAAQKALTGGLRASRLEGAEVNGRLGVIFSREDLSVGMVGQPVDGVVGYDPETATALAAAVLTYKAGPDAAAAAATKPTPGATTNPATKPSSKTSSSKKSKATTKPADG